MSQVECLRFTELHCREVINLCDGARMGEVCDLVIDPVNGRIIAIVVPGNTGIFCALRPKDQIVIPWSCIETLGEDYVLVRFQK